MIYLIRSPESPSRPELFIANQIKELLPDCVDLIPTNLGNDPLAGKSFYDDATFVDNFTKTAIKLSELEILDGDVLFFVEGFNPILPLLDYYFVCKGVNVIKCGIFHSNCCTPGDLFEFSPAIHKLENYILNSSLDEVFVASKYLADNVLKSCNTAKVTVTGLPVPELRTTDCVRDNTVIFSHRWALDKNKDFFKQLASYCSDTDLKFKILTPNANTIDADVAQYNIEVCVCPTKEEYFQQLSKSKVVFSCATLETFGYSVLEGIFSGLIPLVPDLASYHDLIDSEYTYNFDPSSLGNLDYELSLCKTLKVKLLELTGTYQGQLTPDNFVTSNFNFHAASTIANRIKELHSGGTNDIR